MINVTCGTKHRTTQRARRIRKRFFSIHLDLTSPAVSSLFANHVFCGKRTTNNKQHIYTSTQNFQPLNVARSYGRVQAANIRQ